MCKEEQQATGDNESQSKPAVDPALIVQGRRGKKPKVDPRLVVNLKASEEPDGSSVRLVEDVPRSDGDTSSEEG